MLEPARKHVGDNPFVSRDFDDVALSRNRVAEAALPGLSFVALLAAAPLAAEAMVLEGDASAAYASGELVVFERRDAGARGAMIAARATAGDRVPVAQEPTIVASARIGADGGFRLEVALDGPGPAYFVVRDGIAPDGLRVGPVQGNDFILEPGELVMRLSRPDRFVVEGGDYNDAVYNAWRLSDEYRAAQSDLDRLAAPADGESEEKRRHRVDRLWEVRETLARLEERGMAGVATGHPDLLVRRLAIESARLGGPWMLEALHRLAALAPGDAWVAKRLEQQEVIAEYVEARRKRLRTGDEILDFTGETLDGRKVRLADVRAGSRYVLVEFWASWCGPCRVEIPHMKQAYASFRDRGFEIVSFTVDEDREDWEAASAEEGLPWLDLGMGLGAEAPVAYDVVGVPRNYLVDSRSGRIVARDLRQHRLDGKLEELLAEE